MKSTITIAIIKKKSEKSDKMKNIFSSKNIKVLLLILVMVSIALVGFYSYNEYAYQKITNCVVEGNYSLAESYIDSVSSNYRDLRKIKSLISTIKTIENIDEGDIERVLSRMESYKGFEDEKVNQVYNSLLFSLYKDVVATNSDSIRAEAYTTTLYRENSETTTFASSITDSTTTNYQNETQTTVTTFTTTASVTSETTTEEPTSYYLTTTQQYTSYETTQKPTETTLHNYSTGTVYYVESGEVYHIDPDCRTLARSTNVMSGPIPEGRRACKVCSQ